MKDYSVSCVLEEMMDGSGSGGGYQPVILTEAERHLEDLKDNLHSCKQRSISLWDIKEIMKNMSRMKELRFKIDNHKTEYPEYYL